MISEFDTFAAEFATPILQERFGVSAVAKYYSPGSTVVTVTLSGSLSDVAFRDTGFDTDTGELTREETAKLSLVDRATLAAAGVKGFERGASVVIAGERWELDETETRWGQVTVTLGLKRIPLVRMNEVRRAAV